MNIEQAQQAYYEASERAKRDGSEAHAEISVTLERAYEELEALENKRG